MFKIKTQLWLFEKFVGSGNPKCNSVDTHTAEEDEIVWWLLILASLLPRARCEVEMLKVWVGLPHRGHEAWILLAGHTDTLIFLAIHQNVELFSFDLWSCVSCCPVQSNASVTETEACFSSFCQDWKQLLSTEFGYFTSPFNLLHDMTGSGNLCSPGQRMPNTLVMLHPLLKATARQSFPAIGKFFF